MSVGSVAVRAGWNPYFSFSPIPREDIGSWVKRKIREK